MPIVIVVGFPCSGKTTRTNELKDYFETAVNVVVRVISDHSLDVDRNVDYADSRKEREIRSSLKATAQRLLGKDEVVIIDSLNYIKGFRYELYCLSKQTHTTQCLLHCDTNAKTASEWNSQREKTEQYNAELFDELVMRFEAPKSHNRWDSPLFTIQVDDVLPLEAINGALFQRKAPPPNLSTQSQPLSSTNFLYELDKLTQEVVNVIIRDQKTGIAGDQITIPGAKEKFLFIRPLTVMELQRHRRQFITYTKTHPVDDTTKLMNMFVQYLQGSVT